MNNSPPRESRPANIDEAAETFPDVASSIPLDPGVRMHPCGVCVDDEQPHRTGVHSSPWISKFVDVKRIARLERQGRMAQFRALRREQFRKMGEAA